MWPSERWATFIYNLANAGLIVGLLIGIISTAFLVWMGNVKETYLQKNLADTNERAAHAEERAANAELELAKMKTPRTINAEQRAILLKALYKFKTTAYDLSVNPDPESVNLMNALDEILVSMGWIRVPPKNPGVLIGGKGAAYSFQGVAVAVTNNETPELISVATALNVALRSANINSELEIGSISPSNPVGFITNPNTIHIVIGSK